MSRYKVRNFGIKIVKAASLVGTSSIRLQQIGFAEEGYIE